MKFLVLVMMLLTGCVTSGMKTVETKYAPGDCAKLTEATVARDFAGEEATGRALVVKIYGVAEENYVVILYNSGEQVSNISPFDTEALNKDTVPMECPAYLKTVKKSKTPPSAPADPVE